MVYSCLNLQATPIIQQCTRVQINLKKLFLAALNEWKSREIIFQLDKHNFITQNKTIHVQARFLCLPFFFVVVYESVSQS